MGDRKSNRSNGYQHFYAEQSYSNEMMAEFSEHQGISVHYDPDVHEKILDLREQLKDEFWKLVRTKLTPRQRQVIELYAEKKTQIEIAKILGVNQSSITKSVNGNRDYRKDKKVSYGGSLLKLRRFAEDSETIQEILRKIAELQSE